MSDQVSDDLDRKQSATFSLTRGVVQRIQDVLDRNGLPSTERNDLMELLLDYALTAVETGTLGLPIEQVPRIAR